MFYFDTDMSWEAENEVIERASELLRDLDVNIEVKNQARVHLWYPQRFGMPYPQLHTARGGVDRYLVAGTCIALAVDTGKSMRPTAWPTPSREYFGSTPSPRSQSYSSTRPGAIRLVGHGSGLKTHELRRDGLVHGYDGCTRFSRASSS